MITCGVMDKVLHCSFDVSVFELQSRYYIYNQTNTDGKGMNPLWLLFFKDDFEH